jgi:hypothetical protein
LSATRSVGASGLSVFETEDLAQRPAVGRAPFQPARTVDGFERADQQHAEGPSRRQGPTAAPLQGVRRAQLLDEAVEPDRDTLNLQPVLCPGERATSNQDTGTSDCRSRWRTSAVPHLHATAARSGNTP